MYVNIEMSHWRSNEEGVMEPDPTMESPKEVFEKVFLAKASSHCV
jgi:hypothetical protein